MSYLATKHTYGSANAQLVDTNGGADIEVVAAKTGYRIVVDFLYVHASAAMTAAFFESGSTNIFQVGGLAANTGISILEPGFATAAGVALTFSATITGEVTVHVRYHYEGNPA